MNYSQLPYSIGIFHSLRVCFSGKKMCPKKYANPNGIDDEVNQIFVGWITSKSSVTSDDRRRLLWMNWNVSISVPTKKRNINHEICKYILDSPLFPSSSEVSMRIERAIAKCCAHRSFLKMQASERCIVKALIHNFIYMERQLKYLYTVYSSRLSPWHVSSRNSHSVHAKLQT